MEVSLPETLNLINITIIVMVSEGVALTLWRRRTGRGLPVAAIWRMLLPGLCLMAVSWAVSVGEPWPFVPLALTAALIAHLADLRGRWRS
jgi:hypothetical protein